MSLGIIDYGFCNINSVLSSCKEIDNKTQIITEPSECLDFEHIILPGVGNFESAAGHLREKKFAEALLEYVESGKSLLGICLGMQLLLNESDESEKNVKGLGLIEGRCVDVSTKIEDNIPVPHMGWSEVSIVNENNKLTKDIDDGDSFYLENICR